MQEEENNFCILQFDTLSGRNVYLHVDEMPFYPGGINTFIMDCLDNFIYPEDERLQSTFLIMFIVDADGQISSSRIIGKTPSEYNLVEKELLKSIESTEGWQPGKCSGTKVPVLISLPLKIGFQ